MAISPQELRKKTFSVVPKGYDRPEVNRYLAAIAEQLQNFNASTTPEGDAHAEVEQDAAHEPALVAVPEPQDNRPAEATPRTDASTADDFDRVGTEISLMLRQAQESATKIRSDAEIEARTLVDQVRLDIEADRVAHEQAAAELISRTEERATSVRVAAEQYARETREAADHLAQSRTAALQAELAEAEAEAAATRQLTAEHELQANTQAVATVEQAKTQAVEIVSKANAEVQTRTNELLGQARESLKGLVEVESRTRHELEQARLGISQALEQLTIAELDTAVTAGFQQQQQQQQEAS